ncbi:Uncharacterized protein dnm_055110 [Desulfonema magnum]|uniref:Uncharacterized protein n=1 Tax=Desulfonema magnum TaxID=45655 RepID=A0A975GQ30_9BACT|nr:Uncharacterized protein dnm_055110 [Desulfonema magnum]
MALRTIFFLNSIVTGKHSFRIHGNRTPLPNCKFGTPDNFFLKLYSYRKTFLSNTRKPDTPAKLQVWHSGQFFS